MTRTQTGAWFIACRSRELRRRPLAVTIEGSPLVLFRAADGRPGALEDRCAHRNAPLSAGRVCAGRLQCPYHGWEYDAAGRVVHVPAIDAPGALPAIDAHPVAEQDGFVWVAPEGRPFTARPPRFEELGAPGWTSFVMKTRFRATVEACLENFLDCPHATFVHRYWFRAPTARPVRAVVRTLADGAEAEFFDEPREKSAVWSLLAPRRGTMRHTDRYIAPATSRVDYDFPDGRHYTITSSCTPVTEAETEVYTVISFRYGRIGPLVRLLFEPLSRLIIRQDVRMLGLQQSNIERFGSWRFAGTDADLLGPHIVAWRKALATGAAPPAAGAERTVGIRL